MNDTNTMSASTRAAMTDHVIPRDMTSLSETANKKIAQI